jgi:hypothetical protein
MLNKAMKEWAMASTILVPVVLGAVGIGLLVQRETSGIECRRAAASDTVKQSCPLLQP